ncbi:MAG: DinB family protein [Gemmatimonadota bacterium]|nr:DinB family protein [Gemmatimonadota bacterium]
MSTQSPVALLYPELDSELASTRRILERYPEGKVDWKPHEKSMALGPLATHIAQLPQVGAFLLEQDEIDVSTRERKEPAKNSAELLASFDENVARLRTILQTATAEDLERNWTLRFGDKVLVAGKRSALMRTLLINHIIHHRAQLGVYYRLLGIPVPGMYGPSADEPV